MGRRLVNYTHPRPLLHLSHASLTYRLEEESLEFITMHLHSSGINSRKFKADDTEAERGIKGWNKAIKSEIKIKILSCCYKQIEATDSHSISHLLFSLPVLHQGTGSSCCRFDLQIFRSSGFLDHLLLNLFLLTVTSLLLNISFFYRFKDAFHSW